MMRRFLLLVCGLTLFGVQSAYGQSRLDLEGQAEVIGQHFRDVIGQTIARPPSIICDVTLCQEVETEPVLKDLAGLKPGTVITTDGLVQAWARLMKTGYFSKVSLAPSDDEGLGVQFRAVGAVTITNLQVVYDDWHSFVYPKQFVAEVRKRVPLKIGGSFPAKRKDGTYEPGDAERIADYERRIRSLYEELGYLGTIVRIKPHYHGTKNKKVRIKIRLKEGTQPRLGQVLIRGAKAFPYWKIASKLSTGERVDFLKDIFALFGVGTYSRRQLKEELALVEAMYRDEGYVTARVRLESKPAVKNGLMYPRIRIYEGPKLTVKFEGNRRIKDSELMSVMSFATNGSFDDTEVETSRQAIVSAYQAIARYYVDVKAEKVRLDEDEYEVKYTIIEGPRVYVRKVEIVGARQIKAERILETIDTKGVADDGVISALGTSAGIVQEARIINDLTKIRKLYQQEGMPGLQFRCAPSGMTVDRWSTISQLDENQYRGEGPKIAAELTRGQFDIWSPDPIRNQCYQIIPSTDSRLVTLRIELQEGLRSTIERVHLWRLIRTEMDESMQSEMYALLEKEGFVNEFRRWRTNVPMNQQKLDSIRGFLLRHYHQEGYLSAKVEPHCEIEGDPERIDCSAERVYGARIKLLKFNVDKGPRTRVKGLILRGNLKTQDHIIFDELLLKEGQALGSDELFVSQANLRSLGIFDAVNVEYISHEDGAVNKDGDRLATVLVTVEETRPRKVDLYLGLKVDSTPFGAEEELPVLYTIGGAYRHRNIAGYAIEGGVGAKHSNRLDEPGNVLGDEAVWQAGPFLKNRRFFGTRLDLVTEALYQRGQTGQRDAYQEVINAQSTVGYDFYNLSYPNTWGRGLRASLKTEFRHERIRALSREDEIPSFNDPTDSLAFQPLLSWDRRDNPLHPTKGFLILASAELLIPSLLDWSDVPIKTTLTTQFVHSFFKRKLIFVPNFRIGSVWTKKSQDEVKSGFLFKAGGDGVSFPVRGFEDASIDACRGIEDPRYGNFCEDVFPPGVTIDDEFAEPITIGGKGMILGGLEVRFPTFLVDNFWFALFSDVGAIVPEWQYLDEHSFQVSAGGGLRMLVSGQIPLRLDLAYPLTTTPFSEQDLRLHVNIFYQL